MEGLLVWWVGGYFDVGVGEQDRGTVAGTLSRGRVPRDFLDYIVPSRTKEMEVFMS